MHMAIDCTKSLSLRPLIKSFELNYYTCTKPTALACSVVIVMLGRRQIPGYSFNPH